ncbi:MAG: LysR family transcriptional regulator, partial [Comamonadaceae bacterium]
MKTPDLSSRQLRAFLALAELRNFTRAAQACHLSQPAFSALIRTLEASLAVRLFDRSTRSVQLTPEGQRFEASAQRLLHDMQLALGDLADHAQRRRGRVHVAALPSLAMNTVLEVEQLATVTGMVEAGLGISVVPALTLYQFRRD